VIHFKPSAKFNLDTTVIFVSEDQMKDQKFSWENNYIKNILKELNQAKQFAGKNGQLFPVIINKSLVLLVGVGSEEGLLLTALRVITRNAFLSEFLKNSKSIEVIVHKSSDEIYRAVLEGILIGTYSWNKYHSQKKAEIDINQKTIVLVAAKNKALEEIIIISQSANFTRDLVNENADVANSAYLEKTILHLIKQNKNISIEILNEKQMKAKGLFLHLAVNQASQNEPKLIIIKYPGGGGKTDLRHSLVKG